MENFYENVDEVLAELANEQYDKPRLSFNIEEYIVNFINNQTDEEKEQNLIKTLKDMKDNFCEETESKVMLNILSRMIDNSLIYTAYMDTPFGIGLAVVNYSGGVWVPFFTSENETKKVNLPKWAQISQIKLIDAIKIMGDPDSTFNDSAEGLLINPGSLHLGMRTSLAEDLLLAYESESKKVIDHLGSI